MKKITLFLFCTTALASALGINAPHSEKIPDSIAYELVLTNAAPNPTLLIAAVGLTGSDRTSAEKIIKDFAFDKQAHTDALKAGHENFEQYRNKCHELVSFARVQLKAKLTRAGAIRFDTYVQHEKIHMQKHTASPLLGGVES